LSITVICTYTVREGAQDAFRALLDRHWPALEAAGLVTEVPSRLLASQREGSDNTIVEIFDWKSQKASAAAHQVPAVLAIWEPMGQLCEAMRFEHFTALA